MSYSFQYKPGSTSELVLEGEPAYCQVLPFAPARREPELDRGRWLVLAYAVWSGPDRKAVPVALSLVRRLQGKVQLGIRPFNDHAEIRKWCPGVTETAASPLWLFLRDGELVAQLRGLRDEAELLELLQRTLLSPDQSEFPAQRSAPRPSLEVNRP